LSVYGGGFVCLWGWFCLFRGIDLGVMLLYILFIRLGGLLWQMN